MKLKAEKKVNVSATVDGVQVVSPKEGVLYQHIDDKEIYLYIKNPDKTKEIKIHITKK